MPDERETSATVASVPPQPASDPAFFLSQISLRDHFAAAALCGLLAGRVAATGMNSIGDMHRLAAMADEAAGAMMQMRTAE